MVIPELMKAKEKERFLQGREALFHCECEWEKYEILKFNLKYETLKLKVDNAETHMT